MLLSIGARRTVGEAAEPKDLPEYRCVLKQVLLLRRQEVEARGDDSLYGFRHCQLSGFPALGVHLSVLLGVERIATSLREQAPLHIRVEQRLIEQRSE